MEKIEHAAKPQAVVSGISYRLTMPRTKHQTPERKLLAPGLPVERVIVVLGRLGVKNNVALVRRRRVMVDKKEGSRDREIVVVVGHGGGEVAGCCGSSSWRPIAFMYCCRYWCLLAIASPGAPLMLPPAPLGLLRLLTSET
jgi:hypothetical protein